MLLRFAGAASRHALLRSGARTLSASAASDDIFLRPRIAVIGVGGAGGNAVNNMIRANLAGIDFMVANTDAQALHHSPAARKLQLGGTVTRGLGAGANPEIGRLATEEAIKDLVSALEGFSMVFVTAGMGGGTGTGAAPVIAKAARALDIVTVGVVTKPFGFEGKRRMQLAEAGLEELEPCVDTLIVIPNDNLLRSSSTSTTFADAFKMADNVLYEGVRGVTDLIVNPGLVNLDFADVKAVMSNAGRALMGTGEAEGADRAKQAVLHALENPLLEHVAIHDAKGCLVNIQGGSDLTLYEVDEITSCIRDQVHPDANLIFGSTFDESLRDRVRVSVVVTGLAKQQQRREKVVLRESTPSRIASLGADKENGGGQKGGVESTWRRPTGSVYSAANSEEAQEGGESAMTKAKKAFWKHW